MIDDPIYAEFEGTVTLTLSMDDAVVLSLFLGSLCSNDFDHNIQHRQNIPKRSQQVTGKVYRALTGRANPQRDEAQTDRQARSAE